MLKAFLGGTSGSRKSEAVDTGLQAAKLALTTLTKAGKLAGPIAPGLQTAAGLAIQIVEIVEGVRLNKHKYERLADDVCQYVYYVILCTQGREGPIQSKEVLYNLKELQKTLHQIRTSVLTRLRYNLFWRVIRYKSDVDAIKEDREKLQQAISFFGFKADVSIQENILNVQSIMSEVQHDVKEIKQDVKDIIERDKRLKKTNSYPRPEPWKQGAKKSGPIISANNSKFKDVQMINVGGDYRP